MVLQSKSQTQIGVSTMQILAVFTACLLIASTQGCKKRSNQANLAGISAKRKGNEPYKTYDIWVVYKSKTHTEVGAILFGTSYKAVDPAELTLVDINGEVVARSPVQVAVFQFVAIGGGYSNDSETGIDLFHGKKLADILGNYYGGSIGLDLAIGAGGDVGINRHGVVLRNLSLKHTGVYAQVGPQIISIQAVKPDDPFWQLTVETTRSPYFLGDSVNRRAWMLDHSVPKDTHRAYLSLNWDPEARNFFAEVLIIDEKMNTIVKKTRLDYDKTKDQFVYASGLLEMHLGLLGDESNESCFLRWNGQPDTSIAGDCTGWNSFVRSVLGPNGKLSNTKP